MKQLIGLLELLIKQVTMAIEPLPSKHHFRQQCRRQLTWVRAGLYRISQHSMGLIHLQELQNMIWILQEQFLYYQRKPDQKVDIQGCLKTTNVLLIEIAKVIHEHQNQNSA
jgi:hypothetical protein